MKNHGRSKWTALTRQGLAFVLVAVMLLGYFLPGGVQATEDPTDPTAETTAPATEETTATEPEGTTAPTETQPEETTAPMEPEETTNQNIETVISAETAEVSGIIPGNAKLEMMEVSEDKVEILKKVSQAETSTATFSLRRRSAYDTEIFHLWSHMYDIKIKNEGGEWQPEDVVKVTINNVNPTEIETIKIRHYLDSVDAINAAIENNTAQFYYAEGLSNIFPVEAAAMLAVDSEMIDTLCYTVISSADGGVSINEDGSISFETSSFSIFAVESDFVADSSTVKVVKSGDKYTLEKSIVVGDTICLKWDKDKGLGEIANPTDVRGVWSVASGTDIVEIESYREKDIDGSEASELFDKTYEYFFVKVKALKEGKATLNFTFREGALSPNARTTLQVEIEVVGSDFWIKDEIATTGCLVPVTTRSDIVSYEWSKKIGNTSASIDPDALSDVYAVEGGVNIAVDKGGIDEADYAIKTYTVKGLDASGKVVASADFEVKYGNEVLNGSFENTNVNYGTTGAGLSIHAQLPNGYPNLYWQTTGTGAIRYNEDKTVSADMLGHDIEIFHDQYIGENQAYEDAVNAGTIPAVGLCHSYDGYEEASNGANKTIEITQADGTKKAYAVPKRNKVPAGYGHQAAELNCEEYGALYQDVLTTPGAELYWQVYHTARFDDKYGLDTSTNTYSTSGAVLQKDNTRRDHDYMCVVIMPTEHARKIITKTDIDNLLANISYNDKQYEYDNSKGAGGGFYEKGTNYSGTPLREIKNAQAVIDGETVTFDIVECKADNDKWYLNTGSYEVPDGQYLTRFFFVATITVTDNLAGGNFIDGIAFGERKPYKVEYYVQGEFAGTGFGKLDVLDEAGMTGEATASAKHTGASELNNYTLSYTTINGKTTSNKATSFSVTPPRDGSVPTLRLYYVKKGIAITKNVEITNNTVLLDTPKELLENYSVTVNLYDNASYTGSPVATADIPFNSITDNNEFSGLYENGLTVMFKNSQGEDFTPEINATYYAKESAPGITDYTNDGLDKTITITTDDKGIATASILNKYQKIENSDITVEKQVTGNMGDWSKDFTFTIKLLNIHEAPAKYIPFPDDFSVDGVTVADDKMSATFSLKHDGSIVLKGVPVGVNLEITEDSGVYLVEVKQGQQVLPTTQSGIAGNKQTTASAEVNIGANEKIIFTNNHDVIIDTGVVLDSLPYILILVGVAAVGVILFVRKRRIED